MQILNFKKPRLEKAQDPHLPLMGLRAELNYEGKLHCPSSTLIYDGTVRIEK